MKTLTSLLICCLFAASYVNAHTLNRPESTNYINGVTALNEGNPEKAYELLNAEINEHPQNGYAHCYMALICNYYGDMKMALDAVNNALELLPQDDNEYRSFAYYTRGTMLLNLKEWDLAATDLTEAIRLNPEDTENYKARAEAYLNNGNYEASFEDVTTALKLDSKADVNDLVLQLLAAAPSAELVNRIASAYTLIK
ncbi:MAG TPA: tetratricopeptide repeat protein [Candidatus Phocaeicola gallinarum]|uniref:Tetratricopeptide repeat protein n=2 Tax=Bacteroides caecicola TaxID=1462569 RepID=A0ABS2F836_9BACE|nr:tetratricopeptide repeat protein [Bacteroides caecicola]HJC95680.1 tetratricopeptide repeat protein [Candidatus Phocaeicola gallinarum]